MFGSLGRMLGVSRPKRSSNPYNAAMPYLEQVPQVASQHLAPYANEPQQYTPGYMNDLYQNMYNEYLPYQRAPENFYYNEFPKEYNQMGSNPQAFLDKMQRGYTPSEGYQYKQRKMLDAMRNSAASGGFAGTRTDQEAQANTVRGLLGEDQQQYLQNLFGLQGAGLGGLERMISGRERGRVREDEIRQREREGRTLALRERALGEQQRESERANRAFQAAEGMAGVGTANLGQLGNFSAMARRQRNLDTDTRNQNVRNILGTLLGSAIGGGGGMGGGGGLPSGGLGF
jgi:hypothetical protein